MVGWGRWVLGPASLSILRLSRLTGANRRQSMRKEQGDHSDIFSALRLWDEKVDELSVLPLFLYY